MLAQLLFVVFVKCARHHDHEIGFAVLESISTRTCVELHTNVHKLQFEMLILCGVLI